MLLFVLIVVTLVITDLSELSVNFEVERTVRSREVILAYSMFGLTKLTKTLLKDR